MGLNTPFPGYQNLKGSALNNIVDELLWCALLVTKLFIGLDRADLEADINTHWAFSHSCLSTIEWHVEMKGSTFTRPR